MLRSARNFFSERNVLEVDCPLISTMACVDAHINLISAKNAQQTCYLHSSPEYGMKRLISMGMGDIFQLSHVFREGEQGRKHNPEFMMAEWYRLNFSFSQMIEETLDFIRLFLGPIPSSTITYRQVFQQYADFDYVQSSTDDLLQRIQDLRILTYPGIEQEGKDALLNLILGSHIEHHLGTNELTVLAYYPASQAALAQTLQLDDELVAERFEVYYQGIELANGYHELANAQEQRQRLIESNQHRRALGKNELPIDERFLQALSEGFPDCCGVAVGFDRLMMLRHQAAHIRDVIPFDFTHA